MEEIINKVASSGLVTIDPATLVASGTRSHLDIADQLWQGLALKEKDFREWLKNTDWSVFQNHHVSISCSADAIIPPWSFMLLASALQPFAASIVVGSPEDLEAELFRRAVKAIPTEEYRDARIVIKGCGDIALPKSAYVDLVNHLQPLSKSIMFGEPCSTVPVFKKRT
ncbi:MAG: DUF2480 family protein [Flavobacteriales bacterium]|nr:DUF2480 family protein [Flavobacteriales bacterium]